MSHVIILVPIVSYVYVWGESTVSPYSCCSMKKKLNSTNALHLSPLIGSNLVVHSDCSSFNCLHVVTNLNHLEFSIDNNNSDCLRLEILKLQAVINKSISLWKRVVPLKFSVNIEFT